MKKLHPSVAILTLSDKGSRGEREDLSGKLLLKFCQALNWEVKHYEILPDEKDLIAEKLIFLADHLKADLILTTGGTGVHPRDVTPDATSQVIEKEVPGLAEFIRFLSFQRTPLAALSRARSGIRGETLIINLPGSPKAIEEIFPHLTEIIEHAVRKIKGDTYECARG
jgi:molybdenum cofactor synthesis domain-containing protein